MHPISTASHGTPSSMMSGKGSEIIGVFLLGDIGGNFKSSPYINLNCLDQIYLLFHVSPLRTITMEMSFVRILYNRSHKNGDGCRQHKSTLWRSVGES